MRNNPHHPHHHCDYDRPHRERRVVLCYKNFPVAHHVSHIGLGVSALNTAKVLRGDGHFCDVWPILGAKDLADRIERTNPRPSHVVIGAPWIPTLDLQAFLVFRFPEIEFAVVCHSNVGFLQADPTAVKNFRELLDQEQGALNFLAGGNSQRFCQWIEAAYSRPCTWLPNLYFLDHNVPPARRPWSGGTLRIGSFGAVRQLKNHLSSCAAAVEISNRYRTDVEFHINVGRVEGGTSVVRSIEAMVDHLPNLKLVKDEWFQWPRFRALIRSMHLLMQPSHTETFNMVTADGAAEGIPSVVSDAIDWAPSHWKAEVDDPRDIARVGLRLLNEPEAGLEGFQALASYNLRGINSWRTWLRA